MGGGGPGRVKGPPEGLSSCRGGDGAGPGAWKLGGQEEGLGFVEKGTEGSRKKGVMWFAVHLEQNLSYVLDRLRGAAGRLCGTKGMGEGDTRHVTVHVAQEVGRNTWSPPTLPGQVHPNPFWYHREAGLRRHRNM